MGRYMYVIDISDSAESSMKYPDLFVGVYTTAERAYEALNASGFTITRKDGKPCHTDGKYIAVVSRCIINPVIGVEEVQLR